jgi:hypothetical protein
MASTARTIVRASSRLRLAAAAAVLLTTLTTTTAAAMVPPVQTRPDANSTSTTTVSAARSGGGSKAPIGRRSKVPVFVLRKGRFTGFDAPGPVGNDNLVKDQQPRPDRRRHLHQPVPADPRLPAARRRQRPVHAH